MLADISSAAAATEARVRDDSTAPLAVSRASSRVRPTMPDISVACVRMPSAACVSPSMTPAEADPKSWV